MSPLSKLGLVLTAVLMLALGTLYGLAKIDVIPVRKMGQKQPALGSALRLIGLYKPAPRPKPVVAAPAPAPDPLAAEKQALKTERAAFEQERADWESQRQAQQRTSQQPRPDTANAPLDPKELARLATVYEEMPADAVNKIFAHLPETEVIALLRLMDEKQVAQILDGITPDRAARLTNALARPAPSTTSPDLAANTP